MGDNPLAEARGLSSHTDKQIMHVIKSENLLILAKLKSADFAIFARIMSTLLRSDLKIGVFFQEDSNKLFFKISNL